jgi:hypothetical protein
MATNTTVDEYLAALDEPLRDVGQRLRRVIDAAIPTATAAVWHGHPVWSRGAVPGRNPVCLLKAYRGYVSFGLWRGQEVADPSGRLEPGARDMAYVKLRTAADIDAALFTHWLTETA